jgi:hypothetical protein
MKSSLVISLVRQSEMSVGHHSMLTCLITKEDFNIEHLWFKLKCV